MALVALVAVLYFAHLLSPVAAIILGILAVVFLPRPWLGMCPIYLALGIRRVQEGGGAPSLPHPEEHEHMKLLIIGGVAGRGHGRREGTKNKRDRRDHHRGARPVVSYANCGLPYYISKDITKRSKLLLQTPEGFDSRYRVKVLVETEALE